MVSGHNVKFGWGDCLYLLTSRWPLVLLIGSMVFLGGAAVKRNVPTLYEAEARLSLGSPRLVEAPEVAKPDFRTRPVHDPVREAAELGSRALLSEVAGPLGLAARWELHDVEALMTRLSSRVTVEVLPQSNGILLRALDDSPAAACELTNAIADRFVGRKDAEAVAEARAKVLRLEEEIRERHREVDSIETGLVALLAEGESGTSATVEDRRRRLVSVKNLIHSLEAKHQLAVIEAGEAKGTARLVAPALPDRAVAMMPFWLSVPGLLGSGLIVGTFSVIGISLAFRRSRWNAIADLMGRFQLHFAGFAPIGGNASVSPGELPASFLEPYREVRNRLLRLPFEDCVWLNVMPMRSATAGGESIVHLASVLADSGRTVLVIDADFRRPALHVFFEAGHHPGLSDYLSGEMRLEETVIRSRRANLWFMPTGPLHEDPGGLLNGKRMQDLVRDLRSRFDYILVSSPSIHEVSDAVVLTSIADHNAVFTPYRGFSARRLRETRVALETVNASLSGILLTTPADGGRNPQTPIANARRESGAGVR